ncbi:unnamed protein product [Lampetra planeri]
MFVLAASLCVVPRTRAKVFARCELAKALHDMGVGKASLGDWVCLAQAESSYNTRATYHNYNGSTDYGIFQINSNWWSSAVPLTASLPQLCCFFSTSSLLFTDLLDDDITKSVACAKLILKQQGLKAWYGWKSKCQDFDVSVYLQGCKF